MDLLFSFHVIVVVKIEFGGSSAKPSIPKSHTRHDTKFWKRKKKKKKKRVYRVRRASEDVMSDYPLQGLCLAA
jgi:hypothetical protein